SGPTTSLFRRAGGRRGVGLAVAAAAGYWAWMPCRAARAGPRAASAAVGPDPRRRRTTRARATEYGCENSSQKSLPFQMRLEVSLLLCLIPDPRSTFLCCAYGTGVEPRRHPPGEISGNLFPAVK